MPAATIIGAGPAGSVAAIVLARAGWQVTLIEQHRFPRDKVCGECISALGIEVLERLDLAGDLNPRKLTRSALVAPDGTSAVLTLPRPMWGVSRAKLDDALLDHARAAGAHIEQPARCESIEGTCVAVRDLSTNRTHRIDGDQILIADGKSARGSDIVDLGVKAHFVNVRDDDQTISLFGLNGHYVGLAPIEDDRWNLCMSVPAARVRACRGDLHNLYEQCLNENDGLKQRMRNAHKVTPWLASPLPRYSVARTWPANVIPLGNAAAALEPIGGEGIGLALRSAELAATSLASSRQVDRKEFSHLWQLRSAAARGLAKLLSSPAIASAMIDFMRGNEEVNRLVMSCMGKT